MRMQATPPALLQPLMVDGQPFLLKELQPTQDRIALASAKGKLRRLEDLVATMGRIAAWDQLRSSGRQGAAIADELIAFAHDPNWQPLVVDYAQTYKRQGQSGSAGILRRIRRLRHGNVGVALTSGIGILPVLPD